MGVQVGLEALVAEMGRVKQAGWAEWTVKMQEGDGRKDNDRGAFRPETLRSGLGEGGALGTSQ